MTTRRHPESKSTGYVALVALFLVACGALDVGDVTYFHDDFSTGDTRRFNEPPRHAYTSSGIGVYAFEGGAVDVAPGLDPAAQLTLQQQPGRFEQAGLVRPLPVADVVYISAYYRMPSGTGVPSGWIVMQYRGQTDVPDRVDLDQLFQMVLRQTDGDFKVELQQSPSGSASPVVLAPAGDAPSFTPDRWVHLEMGVRMSLGADGWVKVWQDGELIHDLQNVATLAVPDRALALWVSMASDITPAPVPLWIDNVAVTSTRWYRHGRRPTAARTPRP